MRLPSRFRIALGPWYRPNGLNLLPTGLNWNLAAGMPGRARAAGGAKRMPRPGSRWSRARRAAKARAARGAKTCPDGRMKEARRPKPEAAGIRHDLVARVRQDIVAGAYDDPAKLEAALGRMLARLADD